MPKLFYSSVIPASIDRVWAEIRDFNKIRTWHPAFRESSIEEGRPGDVVGCIRSSRLNTGERFKERLLALSDRDHICTYTMLASPLPLTDYVSTIQLLPVADANQTYAQWTCEFKCRPEFERDMLETVRSVYQAGFDFLKDRFSR